MVVKCSPLDLESVTACQIGNKKAFHNSVSYRNIIYESNLSFWGIRKGDEELECKGSVII